MITETASLPRASGLAPGRWRLHRPGRASGAHGCYSEMSMFASKSAKKASSAAKTWANTPAGA